MKSVATREWTGERGSGVAPKLLLSHPTGNANVRQALLALHQRGMLAEFWTTIRWDPASAWNALLPPRVRAEANRRSYPQVPAAMVHTQPWRETARLLAMRAGLDRWTQANESPLSPASVCSALDDAVARRVERGGLEAVYAYEDGGLETFRAARRNGIRTVYELPIAYWRAMHELLEEEAELCPEWAETLPSRRDSSEKTDRKDAELELADLIVVPSRYAAETLPQSLRGRARVEICPYGAPQVLDNALWNGDARRMRGSQKRSASKLRVLYVGGLTQRKGIAYLLRAVEALKSRVELTLIGRRVGRCAELERALAGCRYIASLPHAQVLEEMERHDVLVFPSLSDGYGLVILEALSRGVPVITTHNTGGPEVLRDGREGFLIPIRSAEAIAEKLELLDRDRELLEAMSEAALARARECSWDKYRERLASTLGEALRVEGGVPA